MIHDKNESPVSQIIKRSGKSLEPTDFLEVIRTQKSERLSFRRLGSLGFFAVADGHFSVEMKDGDSHSIIRICGPGDLIGFGVWQNSEQAEVYSVRSLEPGLVHFMPQAKYFELRKVLPAFNDLVIDALVRIISIKDERIRSLVKHTVFQRTASVLLNLLRKFGTPCDDGRLIDVEIDRGSLAVLAGTSPETLSRVLTQLEEKGIIRRDRRMIIVRKESELAALS